MQSPNPPSASERAIRAKIAKRFVTEYAYQHNREIPSQRDVDRHVENEIWLSKVFGISPWFEQDIWDLVYDHGVTGTSGRDKERLDALCAEHEIPNTNVACRNKVKVRLS
jgi:hypothetical protein